MIAVVFPGQGSQFVGMGKELYESFPQAKAVFEEVSAAIGFDVAKLCFEADQETLTQTQNAQVALFTCGVAAWRALQGQANVKPHAMAGHSVGEYSALAAAGIVSVGDGAKLVRRRGNVMAEAGKSRPGTMSAVVGLERDVVEEVCRDASGAEISLPQAPPSLTNQSGGGGSRSIVVVANDNCPGQLVISGDVAAVEAAEGLAKERGARMIKRLTVSGAFHSPLMEEPAKLMGQTLKAEIFLGTRNEERGTSESKGWQSQVRVYSNVTSERVDGATEWPELLQAQLRNPVRWTESVQNMIADGATTFIECGAGQVLCGLIRRVSKEVKTLSVDNLASLEATVQELSQTGVPA